MSTTLTYGMVIPASGEKGSVWFPLLETNFTALDAHSHNGTNSVQLTAQAIVSVTDTVHATGWGSVSGKTGLFKQAVTMPAGYLYATKMLSFRDTAGTALHLQHEASTATDAFIVYCNNSALDVVVYYGI